MKPLFVVLVTYNRLAYLKKTIESLLPTLPEGSKVIVHDNHSNELGYEEYLCSIAKDNVYVVLSDKNLGWGRAMNEVLELHPEWREYEYFLESNNDVVYNSDWFEKAKHMLEEHPTIGLLGLWKHPHHGVQEEKSDGLLIKDNMPAVAWLFRAADLEAVLPFPEKGPSKTRGGNGEDTEMVIKTQNLGKWVCGLKEDLAEHMDMYDDKLGQDNEAYL